jgi:hypothetical protein
MKDYKQFLKELPSKTVVLACGKFNPPTMGHELVIKAVKVLAEQRGADHVIYASSASDNKKNPLLVEKKLQYLNLVFPKTNFVESMENMPALIKHLKENYKNIVVVTSADKAGAMRRLGVEVISAGEKDPDSDDTLRSAAAKGLYEEFKKGLPTSVREIDSRRLMNDVRIGSGLEAIKEQINLVKDDLREQYFRGEIFNVGEIVESNGEQFEIVKRGSNHLLVKEASGKLTSKWIQDVQPTEKQIKQKKHPQIETENCPQCGKHHEGTCPEDFRQPFDPMFKESFKTWRKNNK